MEDFVVQAAQFASVAKRLGANPDVKEFDAKMRKIAKAKPASKSR